MSACRAGVLIPPLPPSDRFILLRGVPSIFLLLLSSSSCSSSSPSQASVTCRPLMFSVSADRLYVRGCAGVLRGFLLTQPLACSLCLTSFGLPPAFNRDPFDPRTGQDVRSKFGPGSLTFFLLTCCSFFLRIKSIIFALAHQLIREAQCASSEDLAVYSVSNLLLFFCFT